MNISALNTRIVFEKLTVTTDEYGNHGTKAEEYYSCYATVSGTGTEETAAGTTNPRETADFTVRCCAALQAVESDHFRIAAGGHLYNILYVNPMGNRHRSLKFHCDRVKR